MKNDPRIVRLLKRYPKGEDFSDASIDVSHFDTEQLLKICQCQKDSDLSVPKELGEFALGHFGQAFGIEFDRSEFDYYLHSYVRTEFVSSYYSDPTVTSKPAPENGPPTKIPLPEGMQWFSVRPKEGREHYEAYEISQDGSSA
ncbi:MULTISPECIES: hypothetical protein [Geothrix]|uniref:hypothetical protein n=1 Tax=Geothrix TaxID=44675 RepID=UPI001FAE1B15|nr:MULTISPECIES: hypothetical protein [Geothrix]